MGSVLARTVDKRLYDKVRVTDRTPNEHGYVGGEVHGAGATKRHAATEFGPRQLQLFTQYP